MDRKIKEDYIREMNMDEISECVNVIRTAFKTVADELGFTRENAPRFTAFATDDTRLKYQMLVEKRPMYVYLHEGKVVGYYSFGITENGNIELNNLAVLPEFRHLGIGEKLVNDALEKVKAFGKDKIEIGIVEENVKLRKWYEKLGFIHTGTKKFDFFPFTCGYMEKIL
jgi:ribosomal protein S18 acetylase RimI-like enzyme